MPDKLDSAAVLTCLHADSEVWHFVAKSPEYCKVGTASPVWPACVVSLRRLHEFQCEPVGILKNWRRLSHGAQPLMQRYDTDLPASLGIPLVHLRSDSDLLMPWVSCSHWSWILLRFVLQHKPREGWPKDTPEDRLVDPVQSRTAWPFQEGLGKLR